jgi:hypothetical protein
MKLIRYTLTEEGTIPTYVVDGGHLAIANAKTWPQNYDLIGVATDSAPEVGFQDKEELATYLESISSTSIYLENNSIPFPDPVIGQPPVTESVVDWLWGKLDGYQPA